MSALTKAQLTQIADLLAKAKLFEAAAHFKEAAGRSVYDERRERESRGDCGYCNRPKFGWGCRNTRDMDERAVEGDDICFAQLAQIGGERRLEAVVLDRANRIARTQQKVLDTTEDSS